MGKVTKEQAKILSEEELNRTIKKIAEQLGLDELFLFDKFIKSHKLLFSANAELTERNRLLVLENDELNAENMRYKQAFSEVKKHVAADGFIISILNKALEESK